jgi:hypothetical protein
LYLVRLPASIRAAVMTFLVIIPAAARSQVSPAAGSVPPDDTPVIKIGATIFTDYTLTKAPKIRDANGDSVSLSAFNVARAYLNITGSISHLMAFRITPDIARETGTGPSLSGSLEYRLKYAYGQLSLDDWTNKGSWIRIGIQQTPWVDFEEGIYRYRFQGPVFMDREGYLSSSDAGLSLKWMLPSNYGDVHVGMYNGETYSKAETNDQKALQGRFTLRPFATQAPVLRGFRLSAFYDADHYVADAPRTRVIGAVTYEHQYVNVGAQYAKTTDQAVAKPTPAAEIDGKGYSLWVTPKTKNGWEALLRMDNLTPNDASATSTQKRKRTIAGIAYWLPHQGSVSSGWLLNVDNTTFDNFTPALAKQTRLSLHGLINF